MNNLLSFKENKTASLNTFCACMKIENEHSAMQLKVCGERSLFLYNMEIVDAQCDYMQTVQKASLQLMLIFIILSWKKYLKTIPNGTT